MTDSPTAPPADALTPLYHKLVEKAHLLLDAITPEAVADAPLNQQASALGVLIEKLLKLQETVEASPAHNSKEKVIRIEYKHADGRISDAPPWAGAHPGRSGALQGRGLRSPLGQNATRQNGAD